MSNVSTVNKLLEQIQALSVAIEEQKRVLFNLEQRRSNARMTLNSYLDPMARLPLEIQSQIFLDVEPGTASKVPHPLAAPMVFLTISRLWHAIALAVDYIEDRGVATQGWLYRTLQSLDPAHSESSLVALFGRSSWISAARSQHSGLGDPPSRWTGEFKSGTIRHAQG
ncbi:hypothetical protein R3P38DRAFT_3204365 [Favolaschia claudopus]|uniref:F-box domain-containing protein n=1 Tax=Favolaschia claudopus TaxID=2862362 RepID=A0AAW0AS25_9AGAR